MQISSEQLNVIRSILADRSIQVIAFGSRVKGRARLDSDLDLCVKGSQNIPLEELGRLREAFEASNLPFVVDLVDYCDLPESFRIQIDQEGVQIFPSI